MCWMDVCAASLCVLIKLKLQRQWMRPGANHHVCPEEKEREGHANSKILQNCVRPSNLFDWPECFLLSVHSRAIFALHVLRCDPLFTHWPNCGDNFSARFIIPFGWRLSLAASRTQIELRTNKKWMNAWNARSNWRKTAITKSYQWMNCMRSVRVCGRRLCIFEHSEMLKKKNVEKSNHLSY